MQETQETQVPSLAQKDSLEEETATDSSILAWKIPWAKEPGGLQSMGLQRVQHDRATKHILAMLMITTNGEGNGNPLQYPCLENLMDGEAW